MKIAVVTGASSGMGREFVLAIDKEFDHDEIWVIARRKERLEELAGLCSHKIRVLDWDLSERESLEKYKALLEEVKPEIDLLVNNAGYGLFGRFDEMDLDEQLGIAELNDKALTGMCLLSIPYMKSGDTIMNMGSNSCWQPVPYQAVYSASKAYVLSFSRSLGKELEKKGIFVMCICPGWIRTEFMNRAIHDNTISFFDRWYEADAVVKKALADLKKRKRISILGLPVRMQVRLIKFLPVSLVMNIWCRQQKQ